MSLGGRGWLAGWLADRADSGREGLAESGREKLAGWLAGRVWEGEAGWLAEQGVFQLLDRWDYKPSARVCERGVCHRCVFCVSPVC